jgi:hypothetical protein
MKSLLPVHTTGNACKPKKLGNTQNIMRNQKPRKNWGKGIEQGGLIDLVRNLKADSKVISLG